eukprot:139670_1
MSVKSRKYKRLVLLLIIFMILTMIVPIYILDFVFSSDIPIAIQLVMSQSNVTTTFDQLERKKKKRKQKKLNKNKSESSTKQSVYGTLCSDCESFIWALSLTLNVFKLDSFENKTVPMHIFWSEIPKYYSNLTNGNRYQNFVKQLKEIVLNNEIDTMLNKHNFDIKFLIKNEVIQIPEKYWKNNYIGRYPVGWK